MGVVGAFGVFGVTLGAFAVCCAGVLMWCVLFVTAGARVMLNNNRWTAVGLTNGAMGTVRAIVYEAGGGPPSLPKAVFVEFDDGGYVGPAFSGDPPTWVPIEPFQGDFIGTDGKQKDRRQIPLQLCWAMTVRNGRLCIVRGLCWYSCSNVFCVLLAHPCPPASARPCLSGRCTRARARRWRRLCATLAVVSPLWGSLSSRCPGFGS